jgi:hypothetical protein
VFISSTARRAAKMSETLEIILVVIMFFVMIFMGPIILF